MLNEIDDLDLLPFTKAYLDYNSPIKAYMLFKNHMWMTAIVLSSGDTTKKSISLRKWKFNKTKDSWTATSNFIMNNKQQVADTIQVLNNFYDEM